MELSKRYMSRKNWIRVNDRSYAYKTISSETFKGEAGLIHIKSVQKPSTVYYNNTAINIVDNNYYWLQFAPKDEHYWLTVMYNDKSELIQYYFDVTYENHVTNDGESYFYDLYLDVVVLPDGTLFLLDEDELEDALNLKIINKDTFNLAHKTAKGLMKKLEGKEPELREFCNHYFIELKKQLL